MEAWVYFSRSNNMALHDLTSYITPPSNLRCLLGLNLKFIPRKRYTTDDILENTNRFQNNVFIQDYYIQNPQPDFDRANNPDQNNMFNPKLHVPTHWSPPHWKVSKSTVQATEQFCSSLKNLFQKRKSSTNLSAIQQNVLKYLLRKKDFVIAKADKNLGPCLIERDAYIRFALNDHLNCRDTYRKLTYESACQHMYQLRKDVNKFLYKHRDTLTPEAKKFIRKNTKDCEDPFPKLYLLMKIHKNPLKTRPVVSCSGSLLHPLGVWLDTALQPIATSLPSFIASSYDLKEAINNLPPLPQNAKLFTADAVSMYTNIDTYRALGSIRSFLHSKPEFISHPNDAICDALDLIMNNNVFEFGDCYFHQKSGTAMGTPPACCYATIYYAIKEQMLLEKYENNLLFYKRYIDDVFGIWVETNDSLSFEDFQRDLTFHQLKWEVNPLSNSVIFLDLEIYIKESKLLTKMYEKALNLYLYISPFSAHPNGVLAGLIIGNILRIHHLCSEHSVKLQYYNRFYHRLRARGYQPHQLDKLFTRGFKLAAVKPMPTTKNKALMREQQQHNSLLKNREPKDTAILHLPFHPRDPTSQTVQRMFRNKFLSGNKSVAGFNRLTIAYSRPRNLGEILSYRKIQDYDGPPVSSYFD